MSIQEFTLDEQTQQEEFTLDKPTEFTLDEFTLDKKDEKDSFLERFGKSAVREATFGYGFSDERDEPLSVSETVAEVAGGLAGMAVSFTATSIATAGLGGAVQATARGKRLFDLGRSIFTIKKSTKAAQIANVALKSTARNTVVFNAHGQLYKHPTDSNNFKDRVKETIPTTGSALLFSGAGTLGMLGKVGKVIEYPAIGAIGWHMSEDDPDDPLNTEKKLINAGALVAFHGINQAVAKAKATNKEVDLSETKKGVEDTIYELNPDVDRDFAKKTAKTVVDESLDFYRKSSESGESPILELEKVIAEPASIKEIVPPRGDISPPPGKQNRSKMMFQAIQLEKARTDDVKKLLKDLTGKESKGDLSQEELTQYISVLKGGRTGSKEFFEKKVTTYDRVYDNAWRQARAGMTDAPLDKTDTYSQNVFDRITKEEIKATADPKGAKISSWKPLADTISSLGNRTAWNSYQGVTATSRVGDFIQSTASVKFYKDVIEFGGPKNKEVVTSEKFLERVARAADNPDVVDPQARAVLKAMELYDRGKVEFTNPSTGETQSYNAEALSRSARLQQFFLTGNEEFRPRDVLPEKLEGIKKQYNELHDKNNFATATEKFIKLMEGETFGLKKTYTPTRNTPTSADAIKYVMGSDKFIASPTSRYKASIGENVTDPGKLASWINNKIYRDYFTLFGDPELAVLLKSVKDVAPKSYQNMKPFVSSLYKYPDQRGPLDYVRGFASLVFKVYLGSPMGIWASTRNLNQNVAKAPLLPLAEMVKNSMKVRRMSEKEKSWMEIHMTQQLGIEDAQLLNTAIFTRVPLLKQLEATAGRISSVYAGSDRVNRQAIASFIIPMEENVVKPWQAGKITTEQLAKRTKMGLFDDVVQADLISTLYKNPEQFTAKYLQYLTQDVHHRYNRTERSLFAQSEKGRPWSGLLVYPLGTLSKLVRQARILRSSEMEGFSRRQATLAMVNQTAQIGIRVVAWTGGTVAAHTISESLTSEEKTAVKNVGADKVMEWGSWVIPSLMANKVVEGITGKPGRYGMAEIIPGMPLGPGVLAQLQDNVVYPISQYFAATDQITEERALNALMLGVAETATDMIPMVDAFSTWLSIYYEMLNGSLFMDFIPAIASGAFTAEQMREKKFFLDDEIDKRFKYVHREDWDQIEKYKRNIQGILFGGQRSVSKLRNQATMDLVYSSVLDDLASSLYRDDPETAEFMRGMSTEYYNRYLKGSELVPQQVKKAIQGIPYFPGKQALIDRVNKQFGETNE